MAEIDQKQIHDAYWQRRMATPLTAEQQQQQAVLREMSQRRQPLREQLEEGETAKRSLSL